MFHNGYVVYVKWLFCTTAIVHLMKCPGLVGWLNRTRFFCLYSERFRNVSFKFNTIAVARLCVTNFNMHEQI